MEKATRILGTNEVAASDGTWSQCVRRGSVVCISGQISLNSDGQVVGKGDFEAQAKQALDNLMAMLKSAGGSPEDLISINVFLTDIRNRAIFARVRDQYFRDNPPTSTLVEISHLVMEELMIEINGMAVLG
ncbi:MAG: RidA family protein [Coprothermobacterota bacterium]|nr:RidA family protein [Coprothermobacterota bacterium]